MPSTLAGGLSAEGLTLINVLLIDGALVLGLWALIHRLIVAPEKARREKIYQRLEDQSKEIAELKGWKEAHNETHKETLSAIHGLVADVKGFNDRLIKIETKLETTQT